MKSISMLSCDLVFPAKYLMLKTDELKKDFQIKKIAYLGPPGTFSHLATQTYDKNALILPFPTIADAVGALEKNEVDVAFLPKENSTEGSVNQTLDLLIHGPLYITYELSVPIHHQLLSQAQSLGQVTQILSHPQPLAQCRHWLKKHLPKAKLLETHSTTAAVKQVLGIEGSAAIGSKLSAGIYNLPILVENIEDNPLNTTRFIELKQQKNSNSIRLSKSSILLSLPDKPGALVKILNLFSEAGINLNKLESRPSNQKKFDYFFFIDFSGSEYQEKTRSCLNKIKAQCDFYKFLGSYETM